MSRRDLLRGLTSASYWDERRAASRLPAGQDILLDPAECVAWGRGLCDRCEKACPEQAIVFVGMMNPRIYHQRCTLCGDCGPVCPTDAIVLRPRPRAGKEEAL
ncbi:MAG: 4Fe-4S dicluster domain-containing protein [bacterium]|nr:4Fe-4S dicluster domain-containing protein [bacterium]